MKKIFSNQRGALWFEIGIGVVLVGVAASTAFLYFQNQKPQTSTPPAKTVAPQPQPTPKKYLEIKEIGLKLQILAGLEDIIYKSYPEQAATDEKGKAYKVTYVSLSSKSVNEAAKGTEYASGEPAHCEDGSIGSINKFSVDAATLGLAYSYKQRTIGGKYYDLVFADGGYCSSDAKVQKLIKAQMELVKKSFDEAESL